ncbi:hypothetical protein BDV93DRAFT_553370 [Ceratobasidium sp. AG-I]|nr:hypothetical protein BDV93DRAFT_553370 [Ceratobasidium sp. AG-I]
MLFNKFEIWITNPSGDNLEEYAERRVEKNTIECWVPSKEGTNFGIRLKHADPIPKRPKYGLEVELRFDGIKVGGQGIRPSEISKGDFHFVAKSVLNGKQEFCFGKLELTDREDVVRLDDDEGFEPNTVRIILKYTTGFSQVARKDKKSGSIDSKAPSAGATLESTLKPGDQKARHLNEQMTKDLVHDGSAVLTPPVPDKGKVEPSKMWTYKYADKDPVTFVFHYAPEGWLLDKGIKRASTPLPNPEINLVDQEDLLPPQQDICSPRYPPEAFNAAVPSLTDTGAAERDPDGIGAREPFDAAIGALESGPEPNAGPSSLVESLPPEGADDAAVVVDSAESLLTPRKRLRELVPTGVIDVDGLSSDDEVILLEIRPSKDVKRARIDRSESQVVKPEVQDVKPKPEAEEIKPKIKGVKPSLGHENVADNSVLDLWRLGC